MTDPPKKRPWFQLHLSTCVVLMVVAGVLVWANIGSRLEKRGSYSVNLGGLRQVPMDRKLEIECRGWPWSYQDAEYQYEDWSPQVGDRFTQQQMVTYDVRNNPCKNIAELEENIWQHPEAWNKIGLIRNTFAAVSILAAAAFASEVLIRRRALKRQDPAP